MTLALVPFTAHPKYRRSRLELRTIEIVERAFPEGENAQLARSALPSISRRAMLEVECWSFWYSNQTRFESRQST